MARRLQAQEEEEEEARRGQDAATLAVVREATGPMMRGQVEGLGLPRRWLGRASHPRLRRPSRRWRWQLSCRYRPHHQVPAPPSPSTPVAGPSAGVEAVVAPPPVAYSKVMRRPTGGCRSEGRGGGRRRPGRGGPELEGGVVKAGWRVSRRDPANRASMWPYLPPRFALPRHLYALRRWTSGAGPGTRRGSPGTALGWAGTGS